MTWADILVLAIGIVALLLAVATNMIANPLFVMTTAIWLTLFLPGKWPWQ